MMKTFVSTFVVVVMILGLNTCISAQQSDQEIERSYLEIMKKVETGEVKTKHDLSAEEMEILSMHAQLAEKSEKAKKEVKAPVKAQVSVAPKLTEAEYQQRKTEKAAQQKQKVAHKEEVRAKRLAASQPSGAAAKRKALDQKEAELLNAPMSYEVEAELDAIKEQRADLQPKRKTIATADDSELFERAVEMTENFRAKGIEAKAVVVDVKGEKAIKVITSGDNPATPVNQNN